MHKGSKKHINSYDIRFVIRVNTCPDWILNNRNFQFGLDPIKHNNKLGTERTDCFDWIIHSHDENDTK